MLAFSFIAQIRQRFSHEKRARVCLWFDPPGEFERVLPTLVAHCADQSAPQVNLLCYDPLAKQGQLWIKRQVWELGNCSDTRFILYFPLSEERLDGPDDQGRNHLEMLAEYRIAGVDWKIGGKRPTLFSFLKSAGVALPTDQTEQRKLADGGSESLLAKYVAKFALKPALFWEELVTAELVQSRLVGDVDQTILDLAVDPETKWTELTKKGVLSEFLNAVQERLGKTAETDNPVLWVRSLVESLALTEAFSGYGEPSDFPFADRLPPARYREAQVALVRRWLKDANCRGAWDRWVAEVEQHVNLTVWAKGKNGAAYGFPHLVSQRWQNAVQKFIKAAHAEEPFSEYVAGAIQVLQHEAEFARAGESRDFAWDVLLDITRFIESCGSLVRQIPEAMSAGECVRLYVDFAAAVDGGHLRLKAEAAERGIVGAGDVLDRTYAEAAIALNTRFFDFYAAVDSVEVPGLPFVTQHLDAHVWSGHGRRAVVIVDALRYDVALRLKAMLGSNQVVVEPLRAMLPTRTPVGMSAMLPTRFSPTSLKTTGGELHPIYRDLDLSVREYRLSLFKEHGADCREITEIEAAAAKPGKLPGLLVVYGHEEVDAIGHSNGEALIRHVQAELQRIARVIRTLHQWGYAEVNVVTDHGFVLLDEAYLPPPVPLSKEWCLVLKERFAIVPATVDLPVKTKPFSWDASVRVALPPGFAYFKTEKSFSHGGAALQEMVIPHVVSRVQAKAQKIGVEILLAGAGANLSSAAVKVILRPITTSDAGEMTALIALPRALELNVFQRVGDRPVSVLPRGETKRVELGATGEVAATLFFDSKHVFMQGDELRLEVRDVDSGEQFPGTNGITLHFSRNL